MRASRANTSVNFHSSQGSQQSFAKKAYRVQSAVNPRTRDINKVNREKEQLEEEARRYEVELQEIKARNEQIKHLIEQRQQH